MICPRDATQLTDMSGKLIAFNCRSCAGILVQNEGMTKKIESDGISTDKIKPYSYQIISCPNCKAGMLNVTLNGVGVDLCSRCNFVWFDKDEATRIQERMSPEEIQRLNQTNWDADPIEVIDIIVNSRPDWFP